MQATDAYIVSSIRTPVGRARRGSFRHMRPEALGAVAVRGAIDRVEGLRPDVIDDVLIGCAFPEGPQGMNMGRIIALRAGLPNSVPGATINRFCSSGLQTIVMATQMIQSGWSNCIVAGGAESMSQVPMSGYFFQPDPDAVADNIDLYVSMGITAENVASKYGVTRQDQDAFALRSHQRAVDAIANGRFDAEIIPVDVREVTIKDGERIERTFRLDKDEGPREDTSLEALAKLRPVFHAKGSVTAGNASQTSDGAAASVVMSERTMNELGLSPLARVVGFSLAGVEPEMMGIGPVDAIRRVLMQTGLTVEDIGLVELNEAFAAQALAVVREVGLDEETVNVNGGAIALGHPLGCTGAKLTSTLIHEMGRRNVRYGICTMCVGGGMGAAAVIENLQT
jgi:acetyl-CoA acyltransferase